MKALLDARAILFLSADPERLGSEARSLIGYPSVQLNASLASLWETGIKVRSGKLELSVELDAFWDTTVSRGRFEKHERRHPGIGWTEVRARLARIRNKYQPLQKKYHP